ncbi:hypothetical protein NQ318_000546 [Aromia moschata]|uniref:Uncharacterized protein n=1 Tax=Aromia moschata TaxID=1265417 RepID=A0AAV8YDW4_9CUCU|nr:hypothetical protein NQ318_000546 [Aromia moschata]
MESEYLQDGEDEEEPQPRNENIIEPPSLEEIREIVNNLKNNKSTGGDEITAEMLKHGGEKL